MVENPGLDNQYENIIDFNRERERLRHALDVRENEGQVEKNTRILRVNHDDKTASGYFLDRRRYNVNITYGDRDENRFE